MQIPVNFSFGKNSFKHGSCESILNALLNNSFDFQLNFAGLGIGNAGSHLIAQSIVNGLNVTKLVLSANEINDLGACALAEAIERTKSLRYINLGFNEIGDEGAIRLSQALALNPTIDRIILAENQISSIGLNALKSTVRGNRVDLLDLSNTHTNHVARVRQHIVASGEITL